MATKHICDWCKKEVALRKDLFCIEAMVFVKEHQRGHHLADWGSSALIPEEILNKEYCRACVKTLITSHVEPAICAFHKTIRVIQ